MNRLPLYDRACRVKQCFRCYQYGHIGTQCNTSQTCGHCAENHESKHCKQKGTEGFIPKCTTCKGTHNAWSNACSEPQKGYHLLLLSDEEVERIQHAAQRTYQSIQALHEAYHGADKTSDVPQ